MTTYLVTDLINTHNLGCQFQDITDPQHTLSSHLISTASQHILSTHTPLSNTHSRLGLPIASCSTPRHLALFQHTFSPHTLSIYLPPTPSQHILSSHTLNTPFQHSQHPFPTHIPGWGYQLLHALLQDTKDELALVEAVEAHVLLESNEQTLFPVFRLILQLLYDEGA